ncbi:MAG: Holliday junction branch migration protein RuvA [Acholeplasmatales bacterium]|nr:Holliday junction branch migration protein RuvA [Acholeplasmatales bacterium]
MYEYIIGEITKITPKYIVVENNGIGYILIVANPYSFKLGEKIKVYTYQYIREQINDLYGFKEEASKTLFIKLISVSGIGPKSALSILASGNVDRIAEAIEARDDSYLKKFPGIGPKAAQQIILDLKGKISFDEVSVVAGASQKMNDVEEALISLGYAKKDIQKTLGKLDSSKEVGDIIKDALRLLTK